MKQKNLVSLATVLLITACSSSGGSRNGSTAVGGNLHTQFDKPTKFSKELFSKSAGDYAEDMTIYNGGGVDSFKKITIPTYVVDFQRSITQVNRSKMGVLLKGDGTKNELTMNVGLPVDKYEEILKSIADTSYARMKEKFKKAGVEVIEWSAMTKKYEDAAKFEKEKLGQEPVLLSDSMASFKPNEALRLKGGMWQFAASSLSRETEVSLFFPTFAVGYGYFGGEGNEYTIKETHGMAEIQFTPQIQIFSGSGFSYQSKWDTGVVSLNKSLISNEQFVKKVSLASDSRSDATEKGETARGFYMAATGAAAYQTQVSTRAGMNYSLDLDENKFKSAVLAELDKAEDLIVERYKNEL